MMKLADCNVLLYYQNFVFGYACYIPLPPFKGRIHAISPLKGLREMSICNQDEYLAIFTAGTAIRYN